MLIKRWIGNDVDMIPGLAQAYRHPAEWPHAQDWIVTSIRLDTGNRCYWVQGHHRNGAPFFWELYSDRPFDWRYDLTAATYQIGRQETETEARKREYPVLAGHFDQA